MAQESEQGMTSKPKSKKGLIIALAVLVPLLLAGGVLGAAFAGLVTIPGLKLPGKNPANTAAGNYLDKDDKAPPAPSTEVAAEIKPEPKPEEEPATQEPQTDPELGAKKLAGIWNNLDAPDIVRIASTYEDVDFARVLSKMDGEKVAKVLANIKDAKKAARLSRLIESQASVIPETQPY